MSTLQSCLLTYLVNALWQIPLIFVAAAWICHRARRSAPQVRHRVWVAALFLEALLPAGSFLPVTRLAPLWSWLPGFKADASRGDSRISVAWGPAQIHNGSSLFHTVLAAIAALYLVALLFLYLQLAWRLWKTHLLAAHATHAVPGMLNAHWVSASLRLRVPGVVTLAVSREIKGPVTLGIRRQVILLPSQFATALSQEDAGAALAHELAHVLRRDFAKNLLYEAITRPVAWHPLLRRTLAHIAETREMIGDALAADATTGPERYAASLLRLACALLPPTPASTLHAIGIFDTNTLERRIMNLQSRHTQRRLSLSLALGATALTLAVGAFATAAALRIGASAPPPTLRESQGNGPTPRVASGVMAGQLLTHANPVYPEDAKHAGIQGAVILKARIGKDGTIKDLAVLSGPPELAPSAIDAVRQWTYKPYLLNGEPVEVDTTITVTYHLNK